MNSVKPNIGTNIKSARIAAGIDQRALAETIGVTANYISQIETCRKTPSLKTLFAIAHELNVKAEILLGDSALHMEIKSLVNTYGLAETLMEIRNISNSLDDVIQTKT